MDRTLVADTDMTTQAWLEDALGYVYAHGQMYALAYLEAVMDDTIFEMEMDKRRTFFIE